MVVLYCLMEVQDKVLLGSNLIDLFNIVVAVSWLSLLMSKLAFDIADRLCKI